MPRVMPTGWAHRYQQDVIEYLKQENKVSASSYLSRVAYGTAGSCAVVNVQSKA